VFDGNVSKRIAYQMLGEFSNPYSLKIKVH
jgi:hypothetical protein